MGLGWDKDGTPVISFNPGIDPQVWEAQLRRAAGSYVYRIQGCTHSLSELEQVQTELSLGTWSPRASKIAYGIDVSPATCSVQLTSDLLTPSDVRAVAARYGSLVTIDTSSGHPVRLLGSG